MAEFSVTGEELSEVAELAEGLESAQKLDDDELSSVFHDLVRVRDELKGRDGRLRKDTIKEDLGLEGGGKTLNLLQTLQDHDIVTNDSKNWWYTGDQ
jgi:hypothetical protein